MASVHVDVNNAIDGLSGFGRKAELALRVYAETVSKDFESYAKHNRPWTDRTGRARQGLTGYVKTTETGYRIVIAHTVDYGIWLEFARERKYAILEPTVRLKGQEAIQGMKHLLDRLKV